MRTIIIKKKKKAEKVRTKKWEGVGGKFLEAHPASCWLTDKDMTLRYRNSRATVWRWVRERGLPEPVQLSPGCTRWRFSDIERWESQNVSTPRSAA